MDDNPDRFHITYHLNNQVGEALFSFTHTQSAKLSKGKNRLVCHFTNQFFQSGNYSVSLFVIKDKHQAIFIEKELFSFTVVDRSREIGTYMGREPGYIRPKFTWDNENIIQ